MKKITMEEYGTLLQRSLMPGQVIATNHGKLVINPLVDKNSIAVAVYRERHNPGKTHSEVDYFLVSFDGG